MKKKKENKNRLYLGIILACIAVVLIVFAVFAMFGSGGTVNGYVTADNPLVCKVIPTGFTNYQITVSWTAVSGATSYTISRATDPKGTFSAVGSTKATSFTDSGYSGTYYYKTEAMTSKGKVQTPTTSCWAVPGSVFGSGFGVKRLKSLASVL